MASFPNGGVLTAQGSDLKAKTDAGAQLQFVRVVLGDGVADGGTDLTTLTALVNQVAQFDVQSATFLGAGRTRIRTILENTGLLTGFYAKEFGLIANDPDVGEILYAYAAADPGDWIPDESEQFQQIFDFVALTGVTEDITVTLDPNLATVSVLEMQAHEALRVDPTSDDDVELLHLTDAQAKKWEDHTAAATPHVTQTQKDTWDGHVDDGDAHVTAQQKEGWSGHIVDTALHAGGLFKKLYAFAQIESAGDGGGDAIAGTWNTRKTNTIQHDPDNECTVTNYQMVIPAGEYLALSLCPACRVETHQARLQDVANNNTLRYGTSTAAAAEAAVVSDSVLLGPVVVLSNTVMELQHWTLAGYASNGLGIGSSSGENSLFGQIVFLKIS